MNSDIVLSEGLPVVKIPGYMTTEEAAKYLGISAGRVRQLVSIGVMSKEKIGNTNIIPINDVKQYELSRGNPGWPKGKKRKS